MEARGRQGQAFVVTGATSGIGRATARSLARSGYLVFGTGRDADRCRESERELEALSPLGHRYFQADLSSLANVRALAAELRSAAEALPGKALAGLVNNAGTYSSWYQATEDGFELQLAVNHLAPFLLTHELLSLLRASGDGRVVIVSSASHFGARFPFEDPNLLVSYGELRSYGRSKLANVLFGYELARRLRGDDRVSVHVADPGLARTDMGYKGTSAVARAFWTLQRLRASPPERPARSIAFLLTDDGVRDRGGLYWRDSRPLRSSRASRDPGDARRLWALSEDMCGIGSGTYGLGPGKDG